MDESRTESDVENLSAMLDGSDALDEALVDAIGSTDYRPYDQSNRVIAAVSAASVAWEHSRAARQLVGAGMFTTAFAVAPAA